MTGLADTLRALANDAAETTKAKQIKQAENEGVGIEFIPALVAGMWQTWQKEMIKAAQQGKRKVCLSVSEWNMGDVREDLYHKAFLEEAVRSIRSHGLNATGRAEFTPYNGGEVYLREAHTNFFVDIEW